MGKKSKKREKLVFVYGTLKMGGKLNSQMDRIGATFVGPGRITSKDWVMRHLGGYPALQPVQFDSGDVIYGEVWLTDTKGISELDKVEGYPEHYKRQQVNVWTGEDGDVNLTCTVYYMDGKEQGNEWLWQCEVIRDGTWDVNQSMEGYTQMHQPVDEVPFEANDESPVIEGDDATANFVVEKGVYITNEWGDMYGPYDNIEHAVNAVSHFTDELEHVNVLTIGFRIVREDASGDNLADIDARTISGVGV